MKALVIDNGTGAAAAYPDREGLTFDVARTGPDFAPVLDACDLLVVPNGADHVAMHAIRDDVRRFLARGGALFCFCGWFLDWIPGHRWVHDNSHPTREMRHFAGDDPLGLLRGVDLKGFDFNRHGISGWWACGYIETPAGAHVVIRDTWGRTVAVADDATTGGFLFLTASGPVGDYSRYGDTGPVGQLYNNLLQYVQARDPGRKR